MADDYSTDVNRIQTLLGLDLDADDRSRVEVYVQEARQAIMVYIKPYVDDGTFPQELNYLVDQLALSKFNKFHNEGLNSISEEGLSMSFNANDLKDFLPDIQAWIDHNGGEADELGNAIGW